MTHHWWHHGPSDRFYAVACDSAGRIVSAWMQVDQFEWEALDDFAPLRRADSRGEIHKNREGSTDELAPSRGPMQ